MWQIWCSRTTGPARPPISYLTAGVDGVSRFSDLAVALSERDFAPPAPVMLASAPEPAARLLFLTLPPGWVGRRHPSPRRQVAFCMADRMEVVSGSGETRLVAPGGVWRMEDVSGTGHESRVLDDTPCQLAIVQLD